MTPLVHLVQRSSEANAPLLLLLHGYGSNEEDLFGLGDTFEGYTVVSARAPHTMGKGSYTWFALGFSEDGPVVLEPEQAEESRRLVADFIPWCSTEFGTDPARTVLVGFSQGAIVAADVALTEPGLIKGAVLMSGRIRPESAQTSDTKTQFLIVHGQYDPVLPVANARASREALRRLGIEPDYKEFPMAHQVSEESLELVTDWTARLAQV